MDETIRVSPHEVLGRTIDLSDGRKVFVGTRKGDDSGDTYFAFRNRNGEHTRFVLTPEGTEALCALLVSPEVGLPLAPFLFDDKPKLQWKVITDQESAG